MSDASQAQVSFLFLSFLALLFYTTNIYLAYEWIQQVWLGCNMSHTMGFFSHTISMGMVKTQGVTQTPWFTITVVYRATVE